MKHIPTLLAAWLMLAVPTLLQSQTGKVFDELSLDSKILKMERKYAVYLPPDYESSQRSYPVLYLLHGHGDDQSGWIQFGEVMHIADRAIREGKSTSMIIIMPDGDAIHKGYFNDPSNEWRYEDFFFEEFMPHVESLYRIRADPRYRAIAGLSMGGGGTFVYALRHPELFSSACPLSASTGPADLAHARGWVEGRGWKSVSEKELKAWKEKHYVPDIISSMDAEEVKKVRWYIDCGDEDFLYKGNSLTHILMSDLKIPHEYRVRDGDHSWTYWRESLPEVLGFVSDSFHK